MKSIFIKRSLIARVAPVLLASLVFSRCASNQGGQQQGEAVDGQGQSQGQSQGQQANSVNASLNDGEGDTAAAQGESMNNAVEGGANENFQGANNPATNEFANAENLGESMNNVPIEDTAALTSQTPGNIPLNQGTPLNQNAPLNQGMPLNQGATALTGSDGNTSLQNAVAPTNAALPQETAAPATQASPIAGDSSQRAAASPFNNPQMNWPGKGKVKYVTRQLTKHASPNGPVVGEYEQGEHPLVYQNGNWAELHDGSYVKGNGLSEKAVGYNKGKNNWK